MKRVTVVLISLVLCAFISSNAFAQSNLAFSGIGVKIGLVDPDDVDAALEFGIFTDLGRITSSISLESYVNFWSKTEDITGGGEFYVRDFIIGAKSKYIFSTANPTIRPFAGAGLGFHILQSGVDIPAIDLGGGMIIPAVSEDDTEIKIGLDIGGGILVDLNQSWAIQGETWYSIVSDISQIAIQVGLLYKLGV
ncbi:MAG: outer membrane beta-barrel protein [bacterium]|nr:MAG: outer membrane beta-barrel protein [bacterium]